MDVLLWNLAEESFDSDYFGHRTVHRRHRVLRTAHLLRIELQQGSTIPVSLSWA